MGVDTSPNSVLGVGHPDGLPRGLGLSLGPILLAQPAQSSLPVPPGNAMHACGPFAPEVLHTASLPLIMAVPLTLLASSEEEVLLII